LTMEYFNIEIKGREMRPGYIVYVVQLIHPTFGVYFYVGQTGDRKYTTARPALRRFAGHLSDRGYVTENQVYRAVAVKILGFEEGKNRKAFSKEIKQGVSEFFDRAKTVMHVFPIRDFDFNTTEEQHKVDREYVEMLEGKLLIRLSEIAGRDRVLNNNIRFFKHKLSIEEQTWMKGVFHKLHLQNSELV